METKRKIKIAINGFGRIGRAALKAALEKKHIAVAAINDLTDPKTLAYLLKYDTVYGMYKKNVSASRKKPIRSDDCRGSLKIGETEIPILSQKEPSKLPWKNLKIDVVIESTGFFTNHEAASEHLRAGAKAVIISAPAKDGKTPTKVIGVNTGEKIKDKIISNASCTTNSLARVAKIINDEFGIEKAIMTTVHSYTADQNLVDGPHKDLRRGRAAGQNIVPTTTGAAIAATKTIPELEGKFDGIALRVPTICASLSDIVFLIKKRSTVEEVNDLFRKKSKDPEYSGIVDLTEDPIVSSDIIGNPHSAVVDLGLTKIVDGNLLKILAWYDNEWAYANRLVDMIDELSL